MILCLGFGLRSTRRIGSPRSKSKENEHELSLLAGAKLIEIIERSARRSLSILAALSLVCPAGAECTAFTVRA